MIIGISIALCAASSFAGSTVLDTSGLSDSQIAELKAYAAAVVAQTTKQADGSAVSVTSNPTATLTMAATWGQQAAQAAEGFARALGIAAKELGVTVNDFLHTDAGKFTAAMIIWKVAGVGIINMLYGAVVLVTGLAFTRVIYLRLFTKEFVKLPYSRFFGAFTGERMVRVPKSFSEFRNDGEWLMVWVLIALAVGTLLLGGVFF